MQQSEQDSEHARINLAAHLGTKKRFLASRGRSVKGRNWILHHPRHQKQAAAAVLSRSCRLVRRRMNTVPLKIGVVSVVAFFHSGQFLPFVCVRSVGCSMWALAPYLLRCWLLFFSTSNFLALRIPPSATWQGARLHSSRVLQVVSFISDLSGVRGSENERLQKHGIWQLRISYRCRVPM